MSRKRGNARTQPENDREGNQKKREGKRMEEPASE
jgi:hypothetical protein